MSNVVLFKATTCARYRSTLIWKLLRFGKIDQWKNKNNKKNRNKTIKKI